MNNKIAFISWDRSHPRRRKCAESVGADFYGIKQSRFHPFGEIVKAFALAVKLAAKKYDIILVDGIIAMECAYFFKKFFNRKAKVIFYLCDTTFHKLCDRSALQKKIYLSLTEQVDGFLVVSKMMSDEAKLYLPHKKYYLAPSFSWRDVESLNKNKPDFSRKQMIFVASNRPEKNGEKLIKVHQELDNMPKLFIIGNGFEKYVGEDFKNIEIVGEADPTKYIDKVAFMIQPAAFDPCPTTIFEALGAGLIPVISKNCGNYPLVAQIDKRLVLDDVSEECIKKKLIEIQKFSEKEMKAMSEKAKELSREHSCSVKGIEKFKKAFYQAIEKSSVLRQHTKPNLGKFSR